MRWISQFLKSSWIETIASGLSFELDVNGAKNVNENWDIINKTGHSIFQTGKHESPCQKKNCYNMAINILQMICIGHVLEAPGPYQ